MRTRIYALAAFLCFGAVSIAVDAQGSQHGPQGAQQTRPSPPARWWTSEKYAQELRLTASQTAQIEKIFQDSMARLKDDKDDMERAQGDFRQLMERTDASERELLKAAERLEMARFSISRERTTMLVRIHSVLTPEQRKGLETISKRTESERNRPR